MAKPKPVAEGDVLTFYRQEVVPALAAALTIDDQFPEEVLNEIRNSFTHLAAANAEKVGTPKHTHEMNAAIRHLRRTCVDCLKVCIFTLAKRSESAIEVLAEDLQLPDHVYQKMSDLRRKRMALSAGEGARSLDDPLGDYKSLANEYDEFYVSLDTQFAGDTANDRREAAQKSACHCRWRHRKPAAMSEIARENSVARCLTASLPSFFGGASAGAISGLKISSPPSIGGSSSKARISFEVIQPGEAFTDPIARV